MANEIPPARVRRPDALQVAWHVLADPRTLILLLGLLALFLTLAGVFPQVPPVARGDPQAWLALRTRLPEPVRRPLWELGLFGVTSALWFRALLAVVGVVLLVRLVDSAELAWRATGRTHWAASSFRFWGGRANPMTAVLTKAPDAVEAQLQARLRAHGFRTAPVPQAPEPTRIGSRRGPMLWLRPLVYLACLLALVGLYAGAIWGWQSGDWIPSADGNRFASPDGLHALRLDACAVAPRAPGEAFQLRSQVSWLEGEGVVAQAVVYDGRPSEHRGLAVRQVGYVPALKVRGWDEAGRPLTLQAEDEEVGIPAQVQVAFPSAQAQPLLFLPRRDAFLAFRFEPACAGDPPSVLIDWVRSDGTQRRTLNVLEESGTFEAEGLRLEVDLAYRPMLRLDFRPGWTLAVGGLVLALALLALSWLLPPRLAWLTLVPDEDGATRLLGAALPGAGDGRWLVRLVEELRAETADGE